MYTLFHAVSQIIMKYLMFSHSILQSAGLFVRMERSANHTELDASINCNNNIQNCKRSKYNCHFFKQFSEMYLTNHEMECISGGLVYEVYNKIKFNSVSFQMETQLWRTGIGMNFIISELSDENLALEDWYWYELQNQ